MLDTDFLRDAKCITGDLGMLNIPFHSEGGDTLEQVAQGGCGCPIPGGIQGQAGCGSGQLSLVVGDPAHSRGGWNWMIIMVLFNPGHSMMIKLQQLVHNLCKTANNI